METITPPTSDSLEEVLAEAELLPVIWERLRPLGRLRAVIRAHAVEGGLPKRVFSALEDVTHDVETYLDDHDARSNRTFSLLTEFVACARGFARLGHTIQHFLTRFEKYAFATDLKAYDDFLEDARATLTFVVTSLTTLLDGILAEAARIVGKPVPQEAGSAAELADKLPRMRLPHNLDEGATRSDREKIAEIASQFIAHKSTLDRLSPGRRFDDRDAMRTFILDIADEEQCRFFETKIHNLQSRYDTFVKATEAEAKDPDVKRMRGYVAITLHLLECMTEFVHFYERHEDDIRNEAAKNRIAEMINKDMVLDRICNFALYRAHMFINEAAPLAHDLVKRYTSQGRVELTLPTGVVLHARPVALITKVVNHHGTPVSMTIGRTTVYAGSILKVLMASGANVGERVIIFEGDVRPLDDLKLLFEHRLGEDGVAGLPAAIAYLTRP